MGWGRPSFSSWAACSRPRAFPVSPSSLRGGRSPHPRIDFPCEVSLPALRHPLPVRPWTAPSRASCPLSPSFLPRTPELPGLGWPRPRGAGRGRCCGHLACWDLACCPCPASWVGVLVPLHCTPSGIHFLTPCHLCHGVGSSLPATQQWGQGRAGLRETPARAQGLPGLAGHLQDSWAWGTGEGGRQARAWLPTRTVLRCRCHLSVRAGTAAPTSRAVGAWKGPPDRATQGRALRPAPQASSRAPNRARRGRPVPCPSPRPAPPAPWALPRPLTAAPRRWQPWLLASGLGTAVLIHKNHFSFSFSIQRVRSR